MLAEEWVLEGKGDAAVGIFDVEAHGVAADLAPVADDSQAVIAGGHDAGQVYGSDFKIFCDGDSFFDDGRGKDSGDANLLAGFQSVGALTIAFSLCPPHGFGQFGLGQVSGLLQVLAGDGRNAFSAPGCVDFSSCNG